MTTDLDERAAAERLLAAAEQSGLACTDAPVGLVAVLELVSRAATLLVLDRIRQRAGSYPSSLQTLLSRPEPDVQVERDAALDAADFLGWRDGIDLLSQQTLPCVAPRLHRGWQDKRQSCRQARRITHDAVGFSLDAEQRDGLLRGLALRNRVFVAPPPARLSAAELRASLRVLVELTERLAPDDSVRSLAARLLG
jgi:hypothetical protein